MTQSHRLPLAAVAVLAVAAAAPADVGDPQVKTDHPWYPGELSCSTWDRLFATQAELYRRVTGRPCDTDEDKALAMWLWRNTHYWHGEEGAEDLWGQGFGKGHDAKMREYWAGLFAHGFALCGTTHAQWVAEAEARFGHGRGRSVGTAGHNSFEVFLTGGPYGPGRWALLDHDLSTVAFAPDGSRLLGIGEVAKDWKNLTSRTFKPERQRGWLPSGLHPGDGGSFAKYGVAEYLSGYAGPPPTVRLKRGETLRRYSRPGLDDGATFVFWGRNYNTQGVPGPERSRTWVNQPEKMYGSKTGTPHVDGQARFANAVFTYRPDFATADYKEGVVSEDDAQVTFEFSSPYIIAATPADPGPWGVYEPGCKNGLVLRGKLDCPVSVSVDRGRTWHDCGRFADGLDLTDRVKGHRQYRLKLHAPADKLAGSGLTLTTACQANGSVVPRLADGGSAVTYEATGRGVVSAGPTRPQAQTAVVDGAFDSPRVTLELATPGEPARTVYAAAHVLSSSPPDPKVLYQIEYSTNGGKAWQPLVKDWTINRQGDEPKDFWSQSLCWGQADLPAGADVSSVRVRFKNNGGKRYARAELHLGYDCGPPDGVKVTFAWADKGGDRNYAHTVRPGDTAATWMVPTGAGVTTKWVEYATVPAGR